MSQEFVENPRNFSSVAHRYCKPVIALSDSGTGIVHTVVAKDWKIVTVCVQACVVQMGWSHSTALLLQVANSTVVGVLVSKLMSVDA